MDLKSGLLILVGMPDSKVYQNRLILRSYTRTDRSTDGHEPPYSERSLTPLFRYLSILKSKDRATKKRDRVGT
jgi:hypothetical protein